MPTHGTSNVKRCAFIMVMMVNESIGVDMNRHQTLALDLGRHSLYSSLYEVQFDQRLRELAEVASILSDLGMSSHACTPCSKWSCRIRKDQSRPRQVCTRVIPCTYTRDSITRRRLQCATPQRETYVSANDLRWDEAPGSSKTIDDNLEYHTARTASSFHCLHRKSHKMRTAVNHR
jgi:hypothetical protein